MSNRRAVNLYEVLGVSPDASDAELAAAWKSLIRRHHPDHAPATEISAATAQAAAINAAYQTLRNRETRRRYDRHAGFRHTISVPPEYQGAFGAVLGLAIAYTFLVGRSALGRSSRCADAGL
jgi:curved DNA-binding protein CbpA